MIRVGALAFALLLPLGGCVYYNSIYNAERAFADAEALSRAGLDSAATAAYEDAIRKAASGFRREPEGPWASRALFLLGRAQLRLGRVRESRLALSRALDAAATRADSLDAQVFLASALWASGDRSRALSLVNESLSELRAGEALAEGHMVRARVLLESESAAGWWDLDQAAAADPGRRTEATVERLMWAVRRGEIERAREAFARLLSYSEAGARVDTLGVLAWGAAQAWDPSTAAGLLQGADSASWSRSDRDRIRLLRSELLHASGDTAAATAQAWSVARGAGDGAAAARLRLVEWAVPGLRDLAGARELRAILLPAGSDPRVARTLEELGKVDRFASLGLDEPIGWFAAGEVARDGLGAPRLARGLFLAYVDAQPADPWSPKALLAALDASPDEGDRAWLRGRLEAYPDSPYVRAARGDAAPGFEALEEELATRLTEITTR